MAEEESRAAQAEADVFAYQIDHAIVKAPIDGIVLSGDWQDKRRSPVHKGDELFRVAQKQSLRIEMNVPERDVQHLHDDGTQYGYLATSSLPTEKSKFKVTRIIPLPNVVEQGNTFKVYGEPKR